MEIKKALHKGNGVFGYKENERKCKKMEEIQDSIHKNDKKITMLKERLTKIQNNNKNLTKTYKNPQKGSPRSAPKAKIPNSSPPKTTPLSFSRSKAFI